MKKKRDSIQKPPYKVPSMAEIAALDWNGFNVVSTFSGCGGSCLGYRMAGFKVRWASEFIPAAAKTYKANHPDSFLDRRDIRRVRASEILAAAGLEKGEIDIFDGSPPCASFSTSGKREKAWGEVRKYSDTEQRTDDLFNEYIRLLRGLQPKTFVAENVSGLVKGTAIGYFKQIMRDLQAAGYVVEAALLNAARLGVPQSRQRTIFVGVRRDLADKGFKPVFPDPLPYEYTVRDALPHIINGKYGRNWKPATKPSPTVSASMTYNPATSHQGLELVEAFKVSEQEIADASIERFAIGDEWDKLRRGQKGKYFNFIKPELDKPSPTVTAAGGNGSAASVVHPTEKRKFYIAELKRICGFPDDFVLTGTYQQQWERLGRAVPPVMMAAIASTIRDRILTKL